MKAQKAKGSETVTKCDRLKWKTEDCESVTKRNRLEWKPEDDELVTNCHRLKLGIAGMKPLLSTWKSAKADSAPQGLPRTEAGLQPADPTSAKILKAIKGML